MSYIITCSHFFELLEYSVCPWKPDKHKQTKTHKLYITKFTNILH